VRCRGANSAGWWASSKRHLWRQLGFGEEERPRGVGETERGVISEFDILRPRCAAERD
jgi:hypothetical protein